MLGEAVSLKEAQLRCSGTDFDVLGTDGLQISMRFQRCVFLHLSVTGCRVQFDRLMVITKHKLVPFWCKGLFDMQGMRSLSCQWIYDTVERVFVVPQAPSKLFGLNARMEGER